MTQVDLPNPRTQNGGRQTPTIMYESSILKLADASKRGLDWSDALWTRKRCRLWIRITLMGTLKCVNYKHIFAPRNRMYTRFLYIDKARPSTEGEVPLNMGMNSSGLCFYRYRRELSRQWIDSPVVFKKGCLYRKAAFSVGARYDLTKGTSPEH